MTHRQLQALVNLAQEREYNRRRFDAAIHGIDLDKALAKTSASSPSTVSSNDGLIFKDPKEYEHLTQQEKEALTEKMMKKFKAWAQNPMPQRPDGKRQRAPIDGR